MLLEIQGLKWFSETSSFSMLLKVTTTRTCYAQYSVNCFVFLFANSMIRSRRDGSWVRE